MAYADAHGRSLAGFDGAEPITNEELLELDVDVLAPCAKENQITEGKRWQRSARRSSPKAPTARRRTTADEILQENGVLVIPDILANAGGVTVSYFEWVQDRQGYFWSMDRVNRRLDRMMREAFDKVYDAGQKHDVPLRIAAYIIAIEKVAGALRLRGIYA